jgi:hypothetical protein
VQGEIDMMQMKVTEWEYAHLILEHNLEDKDGRPLNFKNSRDVHLIDGRIGEEISSHISELNNFEEDAEDPETDLGNS